MATKSGDAIPIEERSAIEVTDIGATRIAPDGISVRHPAFDVTPARLITAIITDRGVLRPPYTSAIARASGG
jgi:methylthioribose-1-phosphate isomerase